MKGKEATTLGGHACRLPSMSAYARSDYFDRARLVAVVVLFVAAGIAIAGSFLNWVTISVRPTVDPEADFGGEQIDAPGVRASYSGVDANDGWYVVVGSVVVAAAAAGLAITRRGRYAWLAFIAAIFVGAVALAAYRSVGSLDSSISRRMEIVGDPDPGVGIILVAIGGVAALLGAVLGLISTPARRAESL
jgi:predicted membrane channel-forming protein YqfA (hemolysin III family)